MISKITELAESIVNTFFEVERVDNTLNQEVEHHGELLFAIALFVVFSTLSALQRGLLGWMAVHWAAYLSPISLGNIQVVIHIGYATSLVYFLSKLYKYVKVQESTTH